METPLIDFKGVSKKFANKTVLNQVDLSIYSGQVTSLVGMSGAGKSVLLKLIIGLLEPDSGSIFFKGREINKMTCAEKREMKQLVNFMFQNNALFDSMDVYDNIALPLREKFGIKRKQLQEQVQKKMELLDLKDSQNKFPSQLSGGMQKRVALARALVDEPQVVLFDEPTTGLDPTRKNAVLSMITHNQKNFGFTAVLVSQDVPDVFYISNRVAIIHQAEIIFQGAPEDLEESKHEVIHDFINSQITLENEVMGLSTRRGLENSYKRAVENRLLEDHFVVILFTIRNFSRIQETIGALMAHNIIVSLSKVLHENLDGENNLLGRFCDDRIICILPKLDLESAEQISHNIALELQKRLLVQRSQDPKKCVEFAITSGTILGSPKQSLEDLVEKAYREEKELGKFHCGNQGAWYQNV